MSCLDSLTLIFPGMASRQTTCGFQDLSSTNSDGSSELLLEFISNRQTELNGFLLLAWCVDPTIKDQETTEAPREARGAAEREENWVRSQRCAPTGWDRDNSQRNESSSLQILVCSIQWPYIDKITAVPFPCAGQRLSFTQQEDYGPISSTYHSGCI